MTALAAALATDVAVTFGLAFVAYVLLAVAAAAAVRRQVPRALVVPTAAIALVHVALVWHFRFAWSPERAVEKGLAGFVLFHTVLAALLSLPFLAPRARRGVAILAWLVVSAAALPAPWRYEEIAWLRAPMLVAFGAGVLAVVAGLRWALRTAAATRDTITPR